MKRIRGFTLIELLVVISIIGLLIGILLPALGTARNTARQMQGSTQVRGIQQGMVIFAQGNNGRYPGMDSTGAQVTGILTSTPNTGFSVQGRFRIMLANQLFPAAYLVSPSETQGKTIWDNSGSFGSTDYSFALLEIFTAGTQRVAEWQDTTNAEAIVVSDRVISGTTLTTYDSIHAQDGWRGSVAWNDNHVQFLSMPTAINISTRYGSGTLNNGNDNLFINETTGGATGSNALMIGAGTSTLFN